MKDNRYAERRRELMNRLPPEAAVLIPAATTSIRSADVEHPFRQDSHFWYLTGFLEPDAVALLLPHRPEGEFILFNHPHDPIKAQWEGERIGLEAACTHYGADQSVALDELPALLPSLLSGRSLLYAPFAGERPCFEWLAPILRKSIDDRHVFPQAWHALEPQISELRSIKSADELNALRHAAAISVAAHEELMKACRPGMKESQLAALFAYNIAQRGAVREAYPAIVASGANACVLHYRAHQSTLQAGELLLVDAGAEWEGYAADITRTYPVSGTFSAEQKALYALVLDVQKEMIKQVRPGQTWGELNQACVAHLTRGLKDLKLLKASYEECIDKKLYRAFFMHGLGHWLGMDVHDACPYKKDGQLIPFAPGMVLTIEPGLYVSPQDTSVEACWRGIGIRIEDDVCVTSMGAEVLTSALRKEIHELESR